jgi:pimeloyl-ACP methyl ester carboxylesterase
MRDTSEMFTTQSADGTTIAYRHNGGARQPLLCAHATGLCGSVWTPLLGELGDSISGWTFDFRAHGHSGAAEGESLSWNRMADDVLAVVTAMRAEHGISTPLAAAGHSMGGAALVLAEVRQPGTFRALWLFEPILIPPMPGGGGPGNALSEGAARRRREFPSRDAAYENYSSKPPLNAFTPEALAAYLADGLVDEPDGAVRLACEPAAESQMYLMGGIHDGFANLPSVRCPVTVVRGSDAVPGPASFAPLVADRLLLGSLEDHPDLGHFGPMENPTTMAESIRSALF